MKLEDKIYNFIHNNPLRTALVISAIDTACVQIMKDAENKEGMFNEDRIQLVNPEEFLNIAKEWRTLK